MLNTDKRSKKQLESCHNDSSQMQPLTFLVCEN